MVEKPKVGTAPSNLYINGRYILQPDIFPILSIHKQGTAYEIQLTDAMLRLLAEQPFHGFHYRGRTFDCGSPEGFIVANVAFALWRQDIGDTMAEVISKLLDEVQPPPGATVVVYCHHGIRSLSGAAILEAAGIAAASLKGGIDLWSRVIDPRVPRY